ncbi:hypothetical protein PISMIDRAFT_87523 [Pisolithus microcarpus 441]|uniref:RING-type domain-containing protein n=1 Tax=Pisolithus microcarpus 441 TaxID=765257 RepID=A0A0D0A734_9AGAM|nr:hypothetical protein BKA83DRAFT_87523 [Pisolithus microcarpus]KIK30287.1 hypothetical protein PISMIDRAFT_87523 [Pisolithus microcarpus 441]
MASGPIGQANAKRPVKMTSTQSLNHLLNFTLPPRHTQPQIPPRRGKKPLSHGTWNKERFVNAQYRFVMNPTGDYTVHFADPDIFFQWEDILQVIIPRTSALALTTPISGGARGLDEGLTSCPICLSPPTAPRMTKCGHVFCFPCILHYLSMSKTSNWARCPICFDSVHERQLKSVKWHEPSTRDQKSLIDGISSPSSVHEDDEDLSATSSTLRMRLIQRPHITTLALPRSSTWPSELLPPHQAPFHFLPDVYNFSKFMLATPEYLIADLSRDLEALAAERLSLVAMKDELSLLFIDAVEEKLRHQISKASSLESPHLSNAVMKARIQCEEFERRSILTPNRTESRNISGNVSSDVPVDFLSFRSLPPFTSSPAAAAGPHALAAGSEASLPSRTHKSRRNLNPPPPTTQTYYYYQAASGLPVFLHPLDIKILHSHFRSYPSFPDDITVRIESAAEGSVNEDLRKRCKYLAHMPEGADVVFVEADLESVVGKEGLKNFEGPLKQRTARRKEKEKRDDRARARAEEKARERERLLSRESFVAVHVDRPSIVTPPPVVEVEEICPDAERHSTSGAWGSKSFAAALHSAPASTPVSANKSASDEVNEWDLDAAWHELERGDGRKKRGRKLVLLGGGGRQR